LRWFKLFIGENSLNEFGRKTPPTEIGYRASRSTNQGSIAGHQTLSLAMQHHSAGRLFEAEGIYQQILQADPNQPDALHLLGLIAYQFGKNDTAADLIDQALATRPDYAEAYSNRGLALQEFNQLEDAVASYDKAIGIKPDYAEAYWNKSLALLLCGKFGNGWELYKWRWRCTEIHPLPRDFTQPLWEGGSLDGKTVLVWGEQGVGDEAMFASLIPEIIEQAEHCVIECDPRLVELFNRSFPEATAIARAVPHSERADAPDIDLQAPIADLARWLRPTLESFAPVTSCLIATRHAWPSAAAATSITAGRSWSVSRGAAATENSVSPEHHTRPLGATVPPAGGAVRQSAVWRLRRRSRHRSPASRYRDPA